MTVDNESSAGPGARISADTRTPGRRPQAVRHHNGLTRLSIELATVANMLRSRRFYENVIIGVIVLKALTGLAGEDLARIRVRLVKWDSRQKARELRRAEPRRS